LQGVRATGAVNESDAATVSPQTQGRVRSWYPRGRKHRSPRW
jgi:hypothetical protein